jgi:hypothetical protein
MTINYVKRCFLKYYNQKIAEIIMLSTTEIKFLKNPEAFNSNYRYAMTHRLNLKVQGLPEEIMLLQTSGFLNLMGTRKNLTDFNKINRKDSANQLSNQGLNYAGKVKRGRRGWDSNPCGTDVPRALKARALTTLPPRHNNSTLLIRSFLKCLPNISLN